MLNRNQYDASISTVEISFQQALKRQSKTLLQEIEEQELAYFSRAPDVDEASSLVGQNEQRRSTNGVDISHQHPVPDANEAGSLVYDDPPVDHFIILNDRVAPVCIAPLLETKSRNETDVAFAKGIELLPSHDAFPFFEVAAKRPIRSSDDLYRKIGAFFNMLELEHNPQTVCCILALLNKESPLLTQPQSTFFCSMLEELVPDLETIESNLSRLLKITEDLDKNLERQKGAYRTLFNDQTLSVREDGRAMLYSPTIEAIPPVELTYTVPSNSPAEEIIPGFYAIMPTHVVSEAKIQIRKQYVIGNILLGLMVLLASVLGGGMFVADKRRRELDAMKTEFIATVSHELRTPLSLIRLHAETLHHGRIPESKISAYHQTILTEAERLTGIVNNVLDFSRMERGTLQLHPELTDLSALCERIVESFRSRFEQNGFAVETSIRPGIVISVDALAYSQILFNLIDNAIKYSDAEKRIRIELESVGGWIILCVFDRGIGIPDPLKKKIFDDFVRSDDRTVTARRGSGIGLSVARRLTEEMKGTIEVTDNQPVGSVFTVKLRNGDETVGG